MRDALLGALGSPLSVLVNREEAGGGARAGGGGERLAAACEGTAACHGFRALPSCF